jgi:radical SAM/Cys-rich protein
MMSDEVMDRLFELMSNSSSLTTIDITGGAPELHPRFKALVLYARSLGLHVIDRCNLTILFETGQEETAKFLAANQVEIIASLPCYSAKNVEAQRGKGVFDKSIKALQELNALGYGQKESALKLHLVYNPGGAFLPPDQQKLQLDYKTRLLNDFGIEFNALFTLANVPIHRFAHQLQRDGNYEDYMALLVQSFNPATVSGLMCKSQISVSYDGHLYDCDFNQMLDLPLASTLPNLWDVPSLDDYAARAIITDAHCFACTAGAGSSCGGALT